MAERKGRDTKVTQGSGSIHKRGDGLGTGPVGQGGRKGAGSTGSGSQGSRPSSAGSGSQGSSNRPGPQGGGNRANSSASLLGSLLGGSSSGGGLGKIILIFAVVALLGGGGGLAGLLGGSDTTTTQSTTKANSSSDIISSLTGVATGDLSSVLSNLGISSLLGGSGSSSYSGNFASLLTGGTTTDTYNTWTDEANTGELDTTVASGSGKKRTEILGNNKDVVTIMVYMCGTDLESKYQMGTADLQEMLNATMTNKNLNLIVYTGGCKKWQNNVVSSTTNQIYQISGGKLSVLSNDEGSLCMTDPSTLSGFIKYCADKFPANRYELILWDHGGGSITGYGYDEKYAKKGSMDLNGIQTALKNGGVTFDFIGFDACLMATAETAQMASQFADYLIASEESEPGIGWYYTNWLTKFAANTSLSTLEVGKLIVDDFVTQCAKECAGQATTLSVIDLAEYAAKVPEKLKDFANATSKQVTSSYSTVASARSAAHEFASSSHIDQVDLIDFANRLGTTEAKALATTLKSAVKYNRTSTNVTNAYGVSIYFPNYSTKYVDTAVATNKKIGVDASYGKCISNYASMQASGQISLGGNTSSASNMLNILAGGSNSSSSLDVSSLTGLLGSYFGGSSSSSSSSSSGLDVSSLITGLTSGNIDFFSGRALTDEQAAEYVAENSLDDSRLNWTEDAAGHLYLTLTREEWSLVTDLAMSMYYDDGEGYIDLGVDNIFSFDAEGNLLAPDEATWLAINGQLVAYYYDTMVDDGVNYSISGYVPANLNGERVNLIIVFDNEHPEGYIAGAKVVYSGETEVVAKDLTELQVGDTLDFLCDYYSYSGEYLDSYYLGEAMTVTEKMELGNVRIDAGHANMMYRFTDIYQLTHWSECVLN